jgi:hypothetical protein
MMRDLVDLAVTWWKRDRIRVSPSEGRMFRLQPGTVLCFSCSPGAPRVSVEVVVRKEIKGSDCPRICCFCVTGEGNGALVVTNNVDLPPTIEWFDNGRTFDLHPDDIEVFQCRE